MDPGQSALLIAAGMLAAVANTLAGGGSVITLPLLLALGLDASTANGTNRVGILAQNLVATILYARRGMLPWRALLRHGSPASLGAVAGASLAVELPTFWILKLLGVALLLLAASLWLRPSSLQRARPPAHVWLQAMLMFGVGMYGGLIQAGVGFVLLAVLVFAGGLDVIQANALKLAVVLVYTVCALPLFAAAAQVDWQAGALLAVGHAVGAVVGTWFNRPRWLGGIRVILVLAAIAAALRFLVFA